MKIIHVKNLDSFTDTADTTDEYPPNIRFGTLRAYSIITIVLYIFKIFFYLIFIYWEIIVDRY